MTPHHTKMIMGVRCVNLVEDTLVSLDGGWIGEKTRDFYAQDKFGTVWYLGENTAEYDLPMATSSAQKAPGRPA